MNEMDILHTEMETTDFPLGSDEFSARSDEIQPNFSESGTDTETHEDGVSTAAWSGENETIFSQSGTDAEIEKDDIKKAERSGEIQSKISESDENANFDKERALQPGWSGENETIFSQSGTDAEIERDDIKKAERSGEIQSKNSESDTTEKSVKPSRKRRTKSTAEDSSEEAILLPEETKTEKRRTRRKSGTTVLSVEGDQSVGAETMESRNDLLDLVESMKGKKILTGILEGVERPESNPSLTLAVLYHGDFKILIPAELMLNPPEESSGHSREELMHYNISKRLGAEIDFIVKGIDEEAGIAAASRLEAMDLKRRHYYFGKDRTGGDILYEGLCAEARIVSVIRAGIFVDLFGLEIYIPLRECSYQRLFDASTQFAPGQRTTVKILSIDRSDRDHIKVRASVKQASPNPYEKALKKYGIGNRYVGTVSMVDTNGVFVAMDGGIDCLCSYPRRGRPPVGARVTVRVLGINYEKNRMWGAIVHVTMPR